MVHLNSGSVRSQLARLQQQARSNARAMYQWEAEKVARQLPPELRSEYWRQVRRIKSQM